MVLNVKLAMVISGKMVLIYRCAACSSSVEIATFSIASTISARPANQSET